MKVEIDEKSGFCFGVVNAISKAEKSVENGGTVYCLGDIVHNRVEVSRLESLGLKTVTRTDLPSLGGKTVLIRAHGEPPFIYGKAGEYGIRLIDATCPVVSALQEKVKTAYEKMRTVNGQVVILGKKGHAEVVGLTGQVDEDAIVIEGLDDISQIDLSRPVHLLSQTTQSLELFDKVAAQLNECMGEGMLTVEDTICRQVSNRNPHLADFAAKHDVIIFVSGKKSSNGEALFRTCLAVNPCSYKIEDENELHPEWFTRVDSVGVCGATSTPKWLMEKVARAIEGLE